MDILKTIWKWIDHNRFVTIFTVVAIAIWIGALSCTPLAMDPLNPFHKVTETELQIRFKEWTAQQDVIALKFEAAGEDIQQQKERWSKFEELLISLASGGIPDAPGLLKMALGAGLFGMISDNRRKDKIIKNNKNATA